METKTKLNKWGPIELQSFPGGFSGGSVVKASACNVGDLGSIPGSGRSSGEGNGNPLQYSCLENPMDGGAWWAIVHGVSKSQTRLSDFTFTFKLKSKGNYKQGEKTTLRMGENNSK